MTDAIADDTMFQGLRDIPGGIWRTYLAPDVKVMFESINKNACTSLKWMMADLAGENLDRFRAASKPHLDESEVVHNRKVWTVSPMLDALSPGDRRSIHPDNGWFIFSVVRDPRLRLFSAWQNKLLVETPHGEAWRNEPWYPRHPLTEETVVEDFARFVRAIEQNPEMKLRAEDPHFRDQVELLAEHAIPYTKIYEISELKKLQADLGEHLRLQGTPRELYVPKANRTPLRAVPAVFANGTREAIERIYAADFERFGNLWDFSRVDAAEPWTDAELAACEEEAVLGRRIVQLHNLARRERRKSIAAQARVTKLKAKVTALEKKIAAQERASASTPAPTNTPEVEKARSGRLAWLKRK